jgi:hypothetical protein
LVHRYCSQQRQCPASILRVSRKHQTLLCTKKTFATPFGANKFVTAVLGWAPTESTLLSSHLTNLEQLTDQDNAAAAVEGMSKAAKGVVIGGALREYDGIITGVPVLRAKVPGPRKGK